jgi:transcriptional regulator with XRE-family HTH domain
MGKSLGETIREARLEKELTQKQLAAKIRKEDGTPIAPQYLNDIEHNRRSPSEFVAREIARELDLHADYIILLSGVVPADILEKGFNEATARQASTVFRKKPK